MAIKTRKITNCIIFFTLLVLSLYFLYLVRDVMLTFFLGALLAFLLFRPVSYFESKGLKRVWAIILLYVIVGFVLAVVIALAVPGLVRELSRLAELYPQYAQQAQEMAGRIDRLNAPEQLTQVIDKNFNKVETYIYEALERFLSGFYNFLSKILALIFSPILAFYIMNDWERIKDKFLNFFSPRSRNEIIAVTKEIDNVLIEFIKGHLLVATLVGSATGIAAAFLGVKFPLLIGIVSGITNLVPYFGPLLGGIPAIALAASESLRLAIYMALAIFLIQQVESNLITPKVIGDKLGLHPLVIVFALLAGGKLLGIWGMLFAVPLTAVLKVVATWGYLKMVE